MSIATFHCKSNLENTIFLIIKHKIRLYFFYFKQISKTNSTTMDVLVEMFTYTLWSFLAIYCSYLMKTRFGYATTGGAFIYGYACTGLIFGLVYWEPIDSKVPIFANRILTSFWLACGGALIGFRYTVMANVTELCKNSDWRLYYILMTMVYSFGEISYIGYLHIVIRCIVHAIWYRYISRTDYVLPRILSITTANLLTSEKIDVLKVFAEYIHAQSIVYFDMKVNQPSTLT